MDLYRNALTIGEIPHDHARLFHRRDKTAVADETLRLTYRQLSERTARVAHLLRDLGIRRGGKVAAILQNRAQYVELIYATAGLGAAVVPVSYRFAAPEIVFAIEHVSADVVILDADLLEVFATAHRSLELPDTAVLVVGEGDRGRYRDYETEIAAQPTTVDYLTAEENDAYLLAYTGGTTGAPKACEVPQRPARQVWDVITREFRILDDDVTLIAGPFYHGLGFMFGLQQLAVGGTIVLQRSFDPVAALRLIEREHVTQAPMSPTMFTMLLGAADSEDVDLSSVRGLVSAGAPLMTTTKKRLLDRIPGMRLYEYYGSTEGGFFSVLRPEDQLRKTRCVGLPPAGTQLRILDSDGVDVAAGEVGQIYQRGIRPGARYYRNEEATRANLRGEWLTSGDVGRFDEEGYLYIVDRVKDMVISGGVNIYPAEIERVLADHPRVTDVAVVGIPDDTWGETVVASVVTCDGAPIPTTELDELCLASLARYKRPRHYRFVAALPRTATGKLVKRQIRAEWDGSVALQVTT